MWLNRGFLFCACPYEKSPTSGLYITRVPDFWKPQGCQVCGIGVAPWPADVAEDPAEVAHEGWKDTVWPTSLKD